MAQSVFHRLCKNTLAKAHSVNMKPILVIAPGWGGTRITWGDFMARASEQYEVHCVEMPCFGNEPCPTTVWGIEEYADFLRSKIESIKQQSAGRKIYLLAHSFGGQISVKMLSQDPALVDGMVLSGPAIYRRPWTFKNLLFLPLAKLGTMVFSLPGLRAGGEQARKILYKIAASPDYNRTQGIEREIFKKITRQDVSHYLPLLRLPVRLVAGARDRYVRSHDTARAAQAIPGAQLVIVETGRHGLHHTHPDILLTQLNNLAHP